MAIEPPAAASPTFYVILRCSPDADDGPLKASSTLLASAGARCAVVRNTNARADVAESQTIRLCPEKALV